MAGLTPARFALESYIMRNFLLRGLVLLFCLAGLSCTPWPRPAQESLGLFLGRAEVLIDQQQYGAAAELLEQAALAHPDSPLPLVRMGQVYIKQQRWLMAEDAFNRALARRAELPLATAGLAEALFQQGRLDEAQHYWYYTIDLNPRLPGAFTGLGRVFLNLLDFSAAREAFLKQQDHNPDPAALWYLAALAAPVDRTAALAYLGDIPSAAGAVPPVAGAPAGQDQNRPPETEGQAGDLAAWRDYLATTLSLLPTDASQAEVAKASGIALAQARLWPLAIYALTVARETAPGEDTETLAFLGHALGQAGRPALELLEQAQQAGPNSALPLYFQGLYLREQGALQAAEELFRQAIRLEPENPAFYAELGRTKAGQADLSAAERWYIRAVEAAGEDSRFQLLLAEFYSEYGYRLAEAGIPAVLAVLDVEPDNAVALTILGWMQFQSGAPADARVSLRQALELDPGLVSARYRLARTLEVMGQVTQAAAEYRRVIDLDTSGIYRDRALVDLQRLAQEKVSGFSG